MLLHYLGIIRTQSSCNKLLHHFFLKCYTHTQTAICQRLPGWAGTRRNIHPQTCKKHLFYFTSTLFYLAGLYYWYAFSALTLLVGRQEGRPACKNWVVGCWRGYLSGARTCTWSSWCHCHSLSLASVKSRLVLPFWYRLTWVVRTTTTTTTTV